MCPAFKRDSRLIRELTKRCKERQGPVIGVRLLLTSKNLASKKSMQKCRFEKIKLCNEVLNGWNHQACREEGIPPWSSLTRKRPFHNFFNNLLRPVSENPSTQQGKERLKISKITKFESDLLKTEKDIIPQSRRIFLQTLVWRGLSLCPPRHHTNVSVKILRLYTVEPQHNDPLYNDVPGIWHIVVSWTGFHCIFLSFFNKSLKTVERSIIQSTDMQFLWNLQKCAVDGLPQGNDVIAFFHPQNMHKVSYFTFLDVNSTNWSKYKSDIQDKLWLQPLVF